MDMKLNEKKTVTIAKEEAYGEVKLRFKFKKSELHRNQA
jgi:FKBP-type peptidyl-prolyl cis-trans isomerase 2